MKPTIKLDQIAAMNWHYRQYSLDYFLDAVERIGYTAVAFWAGPPHFHIDHIGYQDVKELKRKLSAHHLKCVCFTAAAGQQVYQFGVYGKEHVDRAVSYFTNGAKIAAELEAGILTASSGNGYFSEPREDCWARTVETMSRVADACKEYGITLAVESLRPPETRTGVTVEDVRKLLEDVGRPNCRPMIDTTAMAVNGETVWDWFRVFGKNIVNTHFIDAAPLGHLTWGDGNLPLEDILRCLNQYGYTGPLGLEITHERYFTDPAAASLQSFRVLRRYAEN